MFEPVPTVIPREVYEDHQIGNMLVKKGQLVGVSFYSQNYNPEVFP